MKKLTVIFLIIFRFAGAQDKLFYTNGKTKTGYLVSIGKDIVFFKKNDTARVEQINKGELILIEDYKGTRHVFATKSINEVTKDSPINETLRQNALKIQPFGVFVGRCMFLFEHLNKDQSIGYVFPLALTFDPVGVFYLPSDSSARRHISGVKFITGMDVNFYMSKKKHTRFFIGPRLRYGTDVFLLNTEAISLQTQFGWDFGSNANLFTQQLSLGFGFVRIMSNSTTRISRNQSNAWFSLNYSIGARW